MANTGLSCENKVLKRKKDMEIPDSENIKCSSSKSQASALSDSSPAGDIEATIKEMNKELNLLFCNYAKTLRTSPKGVGTDNITEIFTSELELSAVDVQYVHEFDEILKDARALEVQLKQKRESLKNSLTMMANHLSL